jgi:hypothetical protein
MHKFKNYMLAAIGVLALASSITLVTTKRAGAQQAAAIARPPAKPASPVEVVNVPSVFIEGTPLAVFDVDNARQPFQRDDALDFGNGGPRGLVDFGIAVVPVNKRLIIEHVSVAGNSFPSNSSQKFNKFSLKTSVNGSDANHYFGWNDQGSDGGNGWNQVISESVRLYADPGTTVRYSMDRSTNLIQSHIQVSISGYFVDVAQFQDIGR